MPERVMEDDLTHGRLVSLRLTPSDLFRPVRIIHRRRKVFSELALGLLKILREEISTPAQTEPFGPELVGANSIEAQPGSPFTHSLWLRSDAKPSVIVSLQIQGKRAAL